MKTYQFPRFASNPLISSVQHYTDYVCLEILANGLENQNPVREL